MKVLLACIFISVMCSCNEGTNKTTKVSETAYADSARFSWLATAIPADCKPDGLGDMLMNEADARQMIKTYDSIYNADRVNNRPSIEAMQKDFWLDANSVQELGKFFRDSSKYNGLSFHFAANPINEADREKYPEPYRNKTELYFFPTMKCGEKPYGNTWAYMNIKSQYIKPYNEVSSRIAVFNRKYVANQPGETQPGSSLSKSVWFSGCVLNFLASIQQQFDLDGFDIALAAYSPNLSNPSRPESARLHPYASTIIIIPTRSDGNGGHTRDFSLMEETKNAFLKYFNGGVLDHGEICPQNCPDDCKP